MKTTSKDNIKYYFNIKTRENNFMSIFIYISSFTRTFDGLFDDGNYKSTIKSIHLSVRKDNYFK